MLQEYIQYKQGVTAYLNSTQWVDNIGTFLSYATVKGVDSNGQEIVIVINTDDPRWESWAVTAGNDIIKENIEYDLEVAVLLEALFKEDLRSFIMEQVYGVKLSDIRISVTNGYDLCNGVRYHLSNKELASNPWETLYVEDNKVLLRDERTGSVDILF